VGKNDSTQSAKVVLKMIKTLLFNNFLLCIFVLQQSLSNYSNYYEVSQDTSANRLIYSYQWLREEFSFGEGAIAPGLWGNESVVREAPV